MLDTSVADQSLMIALTEPKDICQSVVFGLSSCLSARSSTLLMLAGVCARAALTVVHNCISMLLSVQARCHAAYWCGLVNRILRDLRRREVVWSYLSDWVCIRTF